MLIRPITETYVGRFKRCKADKDYSSIKQKKNERAHFNGVINCMNNLFLNDHEFFFMLN